MIRGNNVWNAFRVDAQPSVLTVWGGLGRRPALRPEHAVGFLEMDVIGRGRQRDAQNAAAANGCRDVALLAGPVGVMLVRHQMLGNCAESWTVVPTRLFRPSRSMTRYQYMSLWPKPIVSSHGGTPCAAKSKGYAN